MFSASAEDVKVGGGSKYQAAGVSEKVTISEVKLINNEQYGTQSIQLKTINEHDQEGLSKKLSLNTKISDGKTVAAWTVTAKTLLNLLMSTGKSEEEARAALKQPSVDSLKAKLESELIGKPFRGLFSSREYNPGKFAIELYGSEKLGGNRLVYDPNNKNHNFKLPEADNSNQFATEQKVGTNDLPF